MDEDLKPSIENFDLSIITQFFKSLKRQGPGGEDETLRALQNIPALPTDAQVLDIGCGAGAQTLTLAKQTPYIITATDIATDMLQELDKKAFSAGYTGQIKTLEASMDHLPFEPETFDLLWAESSIFILGFEKGMRLWHPLLKEGGYLAVSEASWLTEKRPKEIAAYGAQNFPGITTIPKNLQRIKKAGYTPVAHFVFQEKSWLANYYAPMKEQIEQYKQQYAEQEQVLSFLKHLKKEIAMYEQYKAYYGYVFYIVKKEKTRTKERSKKLQNLGVDLFTFL